MFLHYFGPNWTLTTIEWVSMEFGSQIYGPQRINPTDFGDPLTFLL